MVVVGTYPGEEKAKYYKQEKKVVKSGFQKSIRTQEASLTKGGRQSSACLRRTENPPCVLVSEAVSVLQNECTVHFSGS